jgi:Zn finger protein HypA/HybF involved in hydrogenase expression
MGVVAFNRTLEQELLTLTRGVSLECLVCGEFVLHRGSAIHCPECGSTLAGEAGSATSQLHFQLQAG